MSLPVHLDARQRSSLTEAINNFGSADRSRGMNYYRHGQVRALLPFAAERATAAFAAEVQGGSLYRVEWSLFDNHWVNVCNCPVHTNCKHAFAAAHTLLSGVAPLAPVFAAGNPLLSRGGFHKSASRGGPSDFEEMASLIEGKIGRGLRDRERGCLHNLVAQWRRLRNGGNVYWFDLKDLGLDSLSSGSREYHPVIVDWWDDRGPLASPLEYWQFLAFFAQNQQIPLPQFLESVTDTSVVAERVATRQRQRQIAHWTDLFAKADSPAPHPALAPVLPAAVRLRLTEPKLSWDFRSAPDGPWQSAKASQVKEWILASATQPAGLAPATLALLQEVQLRRVRYPYWNIGDPQTLSLNEPPTLSLLHWLLSHPELRPLLTSAQGEALQPEPVALHWLGRPLPDRPDDIVFDLVDSEGSPAPANLLCLHGEPRMGIAGRTCYTLPAPLPGHGLRPLAIPREALHSLPALRHLRRTAVRIEGVDLPPLELVVLRPRLVCTLRETPLQPDYLDVQLLAVTPDESLIRRCEGGGRWTTLKGTAHVPAGGPLREYDLSAPEAATALLYGFNLEWFEPRKTWLRRIAVKGFPEQFVDWVDRVRQAGVELLCDPQLAGLARPADRARLEVVAEPAGEQDSAIDWFDLEISVRAEDASLTAAELRLLLKAQGRFVKLSGKGWRRLLVDLGPEETQRLAELGLDATALDEPGGRQRFHALQLADERIAGLLPAQHAERVRQRAAALRAVAPPPVPAGLTAALRPYQKDGFHFLAHLAANGLGGVLADDMGLGKTVEALAWLLHLAGERAATRGAKPLRVLIVCPKSVVPNWELETRRFAPALTVAPLADRAQVPATHLVVANYTQLRLAAAELGAAPWDAVILDEGQNIKNPQSQTARTARDLRATHRLVLTGTPIENRALDLWSLFAFAMPGLLGTQAAFKRNFNDKTDPGSRGRLARRVRHFMLRRTKAQVAADLPPRIEEDLFVDLEGPQRLLYDAELKRTRAILLGVETARDFDRQRFNILQSLLRLRQICCDPRLVGLEAAAGSAGRRERAASAKMEALLDTLEPLVEEGHRVLVFSQFVTLLELVAAELTARHISFLTLTGQTENRQALVDRFQSPEGEPVFLLSLKAAGAGLNLTAASYVVLFDPWWNPAVEAQAIDRTHRIGQKEQVIAYRLLARNTIEEKIRQLQRAKAELARSIVQEENLATVLSLDDLRFVLGTDGAQ